MKLINKYLILILIFIFLVITLGVFVFRFKNNTFFEYTSPSIDNPTINEIFTFNELKIDNIDQIDIPDEITILRFDSDITKFNKTIPNLSIGYFENNNNDILYEDEINQRLKNLNLSPIEIHNLYNSKNYDHQNSHSNEGEHSEEFLRRDLFSFPLYNNSPIINRPNTVMVGKVDQNTNQYHTSIHTQFETNTPKVIESFTLSITEHNQIKTNIEEGFIYFIDTSYITNDYIQIPELLNLNNNSIINLNIIESRLAYFETNNQLTPVLMLDMSIHNLNEKYYFSGFVKLITNYSLFDGNISHQINERYIFPPLVQNIEQIDEEVKLAFSYLDRIDCDNNCNWKYHIETDQCDDSSISEIECTDLNNRINRTIEFYPKENRLIFTLNENLIENYQGKRIFKIKLCVSNDTNNEKLCSRYSETINFTRL